ncbi:MAG: sugar ABC transporter substrate-binding protein [Acidobacteria bacterium]|nr:sugar ABC transporter substrate-binding protein [Acidobacteriota bacterium]
MAGLGGGGAVTRAAAALAAVVALARCGASGAAPGALEMWALGREGEVVAELAREFERENPGERVRVQQVPWTAAHEKLLTAFVGGATPDLAQVGNTWIPEFAELGALLELSPYAARSAGIARDEYFGGIWDTNVLDGRLFGVPWYVDTRLLFYRDDLLARGGLARGPRTWDEWLAAARQLRQRMRPGEYPLLLPTDEWAQVVILGLQSGAEMVHDGRRGAFRAPEFRRAFELYVSLYRQGLAPVASNVQIANLYQQFAEGTFAMYITGPWNLGEFRRRVPREALAHWATAPLPAPGDAGAYPGASLAGGSSLVVFRNSRAPERAWRFVEFLSRPEQQLRFYELTGDLPARRAAWTRSGLAADPHVRAFWEQLDAVRPVPQIPEWEQVTSKIVLHAEAAIRGRSSIDEALAALDRDVDRILEKRRWVLEQRAGAAR